MSIFDRYVRQNHPALADDLIAARKSLQLAMPKSPQLRTGSIYANIMGAISCAQLREGLAEYASSSPVPPGKPPLDTPSIVAPWDAVKGDILFRFLDPPHIINCINLGVVPLGPHTDGKHFSFAALDHQPSYDPVFPSLLKDTDYYKLSPAVTAFVPSIHLQNFWDTMSWLVSFGGITYSNQKFPDFRGDFFHPYYGNLRKVYINTFEITVSRFFAESIQFEGLRIGSTREARRLLRALYALLGTSSTPDRLAATNHPYCVFIDQFLRLLNISLGKTVPAVPALYALHAKLKGITDSYHLKIADIRGLVDRLLRAADVDDEETQKALDAALADAPQAIVFGCPSSVVRSAFCLSAFQRKPKSIIFVNTPNMANVGAFTITSLFYQRCIAEILQRVNISVAILSPDKFVEAYRAKRTYTSRLFVGVMNFLDDNYVLCERGLGQVMTAMISPQTYAVSGSRAKRLDAFKEEGYADSLAAFIWTPDNGYFHSALKHYEIVPKRAFSRLEKYAGLRFDALATDKI
ncbi:MAG: hypothetical protein UT86_C0001G0239 [Candidatus Magasanikbacteria bacterium GW2011_GWC2_40_17]|uniref:Uncharacterized protein n=1 Tax=Candidatus Magasanikbacteria bacterium GW2011_GWA2_42_32 TaxID=1619039 RepID=A0A0G1A9G6_9BACT|nr:MAG: hypothetical protein UT86_C0001G0239 [Candidatus Magasanikbacteria bacterium GW2011_GWC2_40_17]KKS57599.1 MAG: hypothetical protein UV20_C0001G0239 [Candidatus Magasanikbacteria bacterium GW2011_GWA2_42_32]